MFWAGFGHLLTPLTKSIKIGAENLVNLVRGLFKEPWRHFLKMVHGA